MFLSDWRAVLSHLLSVIYYVLQVQTMCVLHGRLSLIETYLILTLSPWARYDDSLFAGEEKAKNKSPQSLSKLKGASIQRPYDSKIRAYFTASNLPYNAFAHFLSEKQYPHSELA